MKWAITAVVGAALLLGCSDPELEAVVAALGDDCVLDSNCGTRNGVQLVCVFGRCHHECETDPDCKELGLDTLCALGDKPTNVCLLEDEAECPVLEGENGLTTFVSAECPGEMVCARDGLCRDACATSGDCLAGQACVKGTCIDPSSDNYDDLTEDGPRGPSATCKYNSDCIQPLVCRGGICEPECFADVDCPIGTLCISKPLGSGEVGDCESPTQSNPELPLHCADGVSSGDETGDDCGGSCAPCGPGQPCDGGEDCAEHVCTAGTCAAPTCQDDTKNGLEAGVDCGGACPAGCPTCTTSADCDSGAICNPQTGLCNAPTCPDGLQNNGETDLDCGGPSCSAPCPPLADCTVPGDCETASCLGGLCQFATCNDNVRNGLETDVDCGGAGSGCLRCAPGADCLVGADCATESCDANGTCAPPSCTDGVKNGLELGVDCGAAACASGCPLGTACGVDADCDSTPGAPAACNPLNQQCSALRTISVTVQGTGSGVVSSLSPALDCSTSCELQAFVGTPVTLTATAGLDSNVVSMSGAVCNVSNPPFECTFVVSTDADVSVTFAGASPGTPNWQVSPSGSYTPTALAANAQGVLFAGGRSLVSNNHGCGALVSNGFDAALTAFGPGPSTLSDSCLGFLLDGGTGEQAVVDLAVDPTTGDLVALLRGEADGIFVQGLGQLACPAGPAVAALVRYPDPLTMLASDALCVGPNLDPQAIAIDPSNGDILWVGGLRSSAAGASMGGSNFVNTSSTANLLIARYDAGLSHVASKHYPKATFLQLVESRFRDVLVTPSGQVVATGTCNGLTNFDGLLASGVGGVGSGSTDDACTVGFTSGLVAQWVHVAGSAADNETGVKLDLFPNGDLLLGVELGGGSLAGVPVSSAGSLDVGAVRLTSLGAEVPLAMVWFGSAGSSHDVLVGASVDPLVSNGFYLAAVLPGPVPAVGSTQEHVVLRYADFSTLSWLSQANSSTNPVSDFRFLVMPDGQPVVAGVAASSDFGAGLLQGPFFLRLTP